MPWNISIGRADDGTYAIRDNDIVLDDLSVSEVLSYIRANLTINLRPAQTTPAPYLGEIGRDDMPHV